MVLVTLVPMFAPITAKTPASKLSCPAKTRVMIRLVVKLELWAMTVASTPAVRAMKGFEAWAKVDSMKSFAESMLASPLNPCDMKRMAHRKR